MDVMKGVDPTLPDAPAEGAKNKQQAEENVKASRKGKEKSVEPVAEEVDDDAAWLARRTGDVSTGLKDGSVGSQSTQLTLV